MFELSHHALCVVGGREGKRSDAKCGGLISESVRNPVLFGGGGVVFCYCFYVVCLFLVLAEFAFRSHIIKRHFSKVDVLPVQ